MSNVGTGTTIRGIENIVPELIILNDVAARLMAYGAAAYREFQSEFGAQLLIEEQDGKGIVTDFYPFRQFANAGYWEAEEGAVDELMQHIAPGDEQKWCGLFHTHPPSAGASMSGTDLQWLKEMFEDGHAYSVIAPVNKDGMVVPSTWKYHYASDTISNRLGRCGLLVVENLSPAFPTVNVENDEITEHVKQIMRKKPVVSNPVTNGNLGFQRPGVGDWILITDYDVEASDAMEKAEPGTIAALDMLVGRVHVVDNVKWEGGVRLAQIGDAWWPDRVFKFETFCYKTFTKLAKALEDEMYSNPNTLWEGLELDTALSIKERVVGSHVKNHGTHKNAKKLAKRGSKR